MNYERLLKIIIAISIFFLFGVTAACWGQQPVYDVDCRDTDGDLIPDCTCTNVYGDIVSCTDVTIIIVPNPGQSGDDDDDDDDNSGGGGTLPLPTPTPALSPAEYALSRRVPIVRTPSKLTGFKMTINPLHAIADYASPVQFELRFETVWSGESQPYKDNDNFLIDIYKQSQDGKVVLYRPDTDYYIDEIYMSGNYLVFLITFKTPILPGNLFVTSVFNDVYGQSLSINIQNNSVYKKSNVFFYGPVDRNIKYRRELPQ